MNACAADTRWFWDAVVKDLDLQLYTPYTQVVDRAAAGVGRAGSPAAQYNYVHDALDKHAERRSARPARHDLGGRGRRGPHPHLRASCTPRSSRVANALKALGVGKGDRVGIFMPMMPEVAIATLAVSQDRRDLHAHLLRLRRAPPWPPG